MAVMPNFLIMGGVSAIVKSLSHPRGEDKVKLTPNAASFISNRKIQ
jgi:hypothetical protein